MIVGSNKEYVMFQGQLIGIFITPAAGQLMVEINQARAVPGKGLEGDRYFQGTGLYSDHPGSDREVTLIEAEAIQALEQEEDILLAPVETRRNLLTQGVPLNHLVGKEFQVGEVTLRGVRLCEPCGYLAKLTRPEVTPALVHRGGLRAQVVSGGVLRVGDVIKAD
jgi:MOSC domain-containing protein YiiM